MRIAFLTPEYPSQASDGGGLGTYVHRMATLLGESGHEPEVFVASERPSHVATDGMIKVHHVNWRQNSKTLDLLQRGVRRAIPSATAHFASGLAFQAWELSAALERRHAEAPFRLVQSADFLATGLAVRRRAGRIHAVRCSSAADLYDEFDGKVSRKAASRARLELYSLRRADLAYAPSQLVANHFRQTHGLGVRVIRPPVFLECKPSPRPPIALPDRYFLHFGQLMARKGTALLAVALPLAWERAPDLTMVWAGRCWDRGKLENWLSGLGHRRNQVIVTGAIAKPDLYAILQRAGAAVLPSQVDNLPNTVIESLMFGIPVIGSRGASIDEIVDERVTGHLAALGNARELADALVAMWNGQSSVRKGFTWASPLAQDMQPERAIANLLALANPEDERSLTPRTMPRIAKGSARLGWD
jgi:glycogen synthase